MTMWREVQYTVRLNETTTSNIPLKFNTGYGTWYLFEWQYTFRVIAKPIVENAEISNAPKFHARYVRLNSLLLLPWSPIL